MAEVADSGRVVWHELQSQAIKRSRVFYEELFNWRFEAPNADGRSRFFNTPSRVIYPAAPATGAMSKFSAPFGPTRWLMFVSVADVAASHARALQLGCATVSVPSEQDGSPQSVLEDPFGARFGLCQRRAPEARTHADPAAGSFYCDELNAPHAEQAFALYSQLFGWSRTTFACGPMPAPESVRSAALAQGPAEMAAHWLPYVQVDALSSARVRAKRLGALVLSERRSSYGAAIVLRDPLGAMIAVCEFAPSR
jgi:predicted enzyme related to lactoylglutathione lyase